MHGVSCPALYRLTEAGRGYAAARQLATRTVLVDGCRRQRHMSLAITPWALLRRLVACDLVDRVELACDGTCDARDIVSATVREVMRSVVRRSASREAPEGRPVDAQRPGAGRRSRLAPAFALLAADLFEAAERSHISALRRRVRGAEVATGGGATGGRGVRAVRTERVDRAAEAQPHFGLTPAERAQLVRCATTTGDRLVVSCDFQRKERGATEVRLTIDFCGGPLSALPSVAHLPLLALLDSHAWSDAVHRQALSLSLMRLCACARTADERCEAWMSRGVRSGTTRVEANVTVSPTGFAAAPPRAPD